MDSFSTSSSAPPEESSIHRAIEAERERALKAVPDASSDPDFANRMTSSLHAFWDSELTRRLDAWRQQKAAHEEELRAAQQAAEEQQRRVNEEQERLQAHLAAVKGLKESLKDDLSKTKDKPKEIVMAKGRMLSGPVDKWFPSAKILKKIADGEYSIDLWHLTQEGAAAAHKAKQDGKDQNIRVEDGEIKVNGKLSGVCADEDLPHHVWVLATHDLADWASRLGRPLAEVEGLVSLTNFMQTHKESAAYPRAFKIWHKRHREKWVISGLGHPNGERADLGVVNPDWWPDLRAAEQQRQREEKDKERDAAIQTLNRKRPASHLDSNTSSSSAGPSKRANFRNRRCLICGSRDPDHRVGTCRATSRVDDRPVLVTRDAEGTLTFLDDKKEPCIGYNRGNCRTNQCRRLHRCTRCGARGHGDSLCTSA